MTDAEIDNLINHYIDFYDDFGNRFIRDINVKKIIKEILKNKEVYDDNIT